MNWFKLLRYDLRNGILRWRYLCVPLLFCPICFYCWVQLYNGGCVGGWMDYLMGCFKGLLPLESIEDLEFPIMWFLVMAGYLFLDLDYPLNDLTEAGQQVVVRCVDKRGWFLSKCAWCLVSTGVYLLLGALTALAFALGSGGEISLNASRWVLMALGIFSDWELDAAQTLVAAVVMPYLTLAALGMLRMVLSLIIKPINSFVVCVCILVVSMFAGSPYVIGNGAMTARNGLLMESLLEPVGMVLTCIGVIIGCAAVGVWRFGRMDHLRNET